MKLDKILKKYESAQAERSALQAAVEDLEAKAQEKKRAAEEIAASGDVPGYEAAKKEADQAAVAVYVKKAQLAKAAAPITPEEAREAWVEYSKNLNKEFDRKYEAYKTARINLSTMLRELVELQRMGFSKRQLIADLSGGVMEYSGIDKNPAYADYPMLTLAEPDVRFDLDFFQKLGLITFEEKTAFMTICNTHTV